MLSIIIPAYNAESTIEKCVCSVLEQSYSELEVVIINDGSTDSTKELCEALAVRDSRVKVINRDNQGVSSARNQGIEAASGDYIMFIDSDDIIPREYCQRFIDIQEEYRKNAFCWCSIYIRSDNGMVPEQRLCYDENNLISIVDRKTCLTLLKKGLLNSPCNKLYKKDVLLENNIRMQVGVSIAEDALFNIKYLEAWGENPIIVMNDVFYEYIRNSDSSLDSRYHDNYYEANIIFYRTLLEDCRKWNVEEKEYDVYYQRLWDILQRSLDNNMSSCSRDPRLQQFRRNDKILSSEEFKVCLEMHKKNMGRRSYYAFKSQKYWIVRLNDWITDKMSRVGRT